MTGATPVPRRDIALGPALPERLGRAVRAAIAPGASSEAVEALVRVLAMTLGVPIATILHYGTSRRDMASAADVDILVLTPDAARGGAWGRAGTVELDLHVAPLDTTLADDPEAWSHVADGTVLFDRTGGRIEAWLQSLPEPGSVLDTDPWGPSGRLRDYVWAHRMIMRAERLIATDPIGAALCEATLLAAVPELYAQTVGRRMTSLTRWRRALRTTAPDLDAALAAYVAKTDRGPDPQGLRAVLDAIWPNGFVVEDGAKG